MQDQSNSLLADGSDQEVSSSRADTLRREVCTIAELSFLMEAHDGLSAAIAERAGFKGLWASGQSIACSLGYPDANEASWSQLVDAVERIVDSSQLPVLVDGDGSGTSTKLACWLVNSAYATLRVLRWKTAAFRS